MPLQYIYTLFLEHDLSLGALAMETVAQQKRDYYQVRGPCCMHYSIHTSPGGRHSTSSAILLMRKLRPRDVEELAQGYPAEIQTRLPVQLQNCFCLFSGLGVGERGGKVLSVPRKRALASLGPGFRKDEVESRWVGESADPGEGPEDERHVVVGSGKMGGSPEAAPRSVLLASPWQPNEMRLRSGGRSLRSSGLKSRSGW